MEASVNLTAELGKLSHGGSLPDLVVSLGSAGSRVLPEKEVFQVTLVGLRGISDGVGGII